jgi:hypothetical protein
VVFERETQLAARGFGSALAMQTIHAKNNRLKAEKLL